MKWDNHSKRDGVLWNRREFLQAGTALGGAALLLPWGVTSRSAYAKGSPTLTRFKGIQGSVARSGSHAGQRQRRLPRPHEAVHP